MTAKRWFLYLLECRDGSVYTGITVDVAARYAAHAGGKGARYTRSNPPERLLAVIDYPDRSSASQAEYEVKTLSAVEKRAYALTIVISACTDKLPKPRKNTFNAKTQRSQRSAKENIEERTSPDW